MPTQDNQTFRPVLSWDSLEDSRHPSVENPSLAQVVQAIKLLDGINTSEVVYQAEEGLDIDAVTIHFGGGEEGMLYPFICIRGKIYSLVRETSFPIQEMLVGGQTVDVPPHGLCTVEEAINIATHFYHHHKPDPSFSWKEFC